MKQPTGRVVLDALLVNDRPTGVGRSILELTRAMARIDWQLHFTVLATHPELFSWLNDNPNWDVRFCPGARGGTLKKAIFTQFKIPAICRGLGADILHSLQFVSPMGLPCANVVTVHDLAWLRFPDTVEEPRRTYYRMMVPRTLKNASAIVTNSKATAVDVQHYYPSCHTVTVTPFGTPSWVWEETPGKKPAPGCRPFFLFVGTLEPRKNLERIVAAYSKLLNLPSEAEQGPWPALVLVGGKGWKDSNLRRLMDPLIQAGDLEVRDYCDTDSLRQLYVSAQALLFPSLHEGFGFPILEAMALGLPVITSSSGAMAEVAGQDALLVDPGKVDELTGAMEKMALSAELREHLKKLGKLRSRKWSWEKTAEETVAVYRRLLS